VVYKCLHSSHWDLQQFFASAVLGFVSPRLRGARKKITYACNAFFILLLVLSTEMVKRAPALSAGLAKSIMSSDSWIDEQSVSRDPRFGCKVSGSSTSTFMEGMNDLIDDLWKV